MSRLYSELQVKGGVGELLEERKGKASSQGISSAKRLRPERSSPKIKTQRKVTKFTETKVGSVKKDPKPSLLKNENPKEANASNPELNRNSQKDDNDSDSDYGTPRGGSRFHCKSCQRAFRSAQAMGGHMSRKHPGESRDYNKKAAVRRRRVLDRARLLLAKKLLYQELGYDYETMKTTKHGRMMLKSLMNRTKLKKLKAKVTKKELEDFIGDRSDV